MREEENSSAEYVNMNFDTNTSTEAIANTDADDVCVMIVYTFFLSVTLMIKLLLWIIPAAFCWQTPVENNNGKRIYDLLSFGWKI